MDIDQGIAKYKAKAEAFIREGYGSVPVYTDWLLALLAEREAMQKVSPRPQLTEEERKTTEIVAAYVDSLAIVAQGRNKELSLPAVYLCDILTILNRITKESPHA